MMSKARYQSNIGSSKPADRPVNFSHFLIWLTRFPWVGIIIESVEWLSINVDGLKKVRFKINCSIVVAQREKYSLALNSFDSLTLCHAKTSNEL